MTNRQAPSTVAFVRLSVRWCLLTVLGSLSLAAAEGSDVLVWDAPPACGTAEQFRTHIETLSGIPLPNLGDDVRIVVVARPAAAAWQVDLQVRRDGDTRVRTVRNGSCQLAMDALALVIALLLDHDAGEPPGPPPSFESTPEKTELVEASPSGSGGPSWQGLLGAALGVGTPLPKPGPGLRLRGGVLYGDTSFEMRAMSWGGQTVHVPEPASATVEILHGAVALVVCHQVAEPWLGELSGCLGPMVSYGQGRARGVSDPGQASGFWWGATLELALSIPLGGPLHFRLAPGTDISVTPPSFVVGGIGRVYRVAPVVSYITIGPELRF